MDLQDQLKNLFPEHKLTETSYSTDEIKKSQEEPIICKYEKRKGKPITILENFKNSFKISSKFSLLVIQIRSLKPDFAIFSQIYFLRFKLIIFCLCR